MEPYAQLAALLDLAEQLGITIRLMPSSTAEDETGGAIVRMKGKEVLFLNADAGVADRLAVVASALAGHPELENRFLAPELRDIIQSNRKPG